ncbi:ribosome-associated protein [Hathewaya proteolytica DSM 3090]|uniref:Ribosome-associated protein n=1 Tax=Hathewaya proteolytica DSM 3090 TaxID=1121331 RepID=A0A1M6MMV4_9CLOT|nr:RNA-binding S4 domain-containing protein [Hathewaya proteolytica]SHJ84754.1 ribosome-associated protein [Hathewaya proteolytica DSM 3090]
MKEISINSEFIKLDSFLKWAGITGMGAEGKFLINDGEIKVNGEVEFQRGKKLYKGDIVSYNSEDYKVV